MPFTICRPSCPSNERVTKARPNNKEKTMKRLLWLLPLLGGISLAGCQDGPSTSPPNRKVTGEEVKKQAADALSTAKAFAQQQKEEYVKHLQSELEKLDAQLAAWKKKASSAKDDAKAGLEEKIQDLEKQRDSFRKKLDGFAKDSKDAWEDLKKGMDNALGDLKDAFDKAKDHFK
jgi:hypothetical protein